MGGGLESFHDRAPLCHLSPGSRSVRNRLEHEVLQMSEPKVKWRVKVLDDKSVVFEVMVNGVKVEEQSFVDLVETVMQGTSSLRYNDPRLR